MDQNPDFKPTSNNFIEQVMRSASNHGWTEGYTFNILEEDKIASFKAEVDELVSKFSITHAQLVDSFPDVDTFTYADGIVDWVIGHLHSKN
jgi:hypothetical protein